MEIENLTLAQIVTTKPQAAALLEKYNLDFCFRGKSKLADQIKDRDKLAEIVIELEKVFSDIRPVDVVYDRMPLAELVDHILQKHHRYVKNNLPVIIEHLENIVYMHGHSFPEINKIAALFIELNRDFEHHMMKEEIILFPRIKVLEKLFNERKTIIEKFSLESPIRVMEAEHETAGSLVEEIKIISHHYTSPKNACLAVRLCYDELKLFEQDFHKHVHLENNILFPKALKMQQELNRVTFN